MVYLTNLAKMLEKQFNVDIIKIITKENILNTLKSDFYEH